MAFYCFANHRRRFVICVDAKCGSNSVREWFAQTVPRPPAFLTMDHYRVPANTVDALAGYQRVFIIRDPLQRLVSFYGQFVVREPWHWCHADRAGRYALEDHTFESFLRKLDLVSSSGEPLQHHLQPQTRTLGSVQIDLVVRLQDLAKRNLEINERLGVDAEFDQLNALDYAEPEPVESWSTPPATLRSQPLAHWATFYSDELLELARRLYARDVDYFESHPWPDPEGEP